MIFRISSFGDLQVPMLVLNKWMGRFFSGGGGAFILEGILEGGS